MEPERPDSSSVRSVPRLGSSITAGTELIQFLRQLGTSRCDEFAHVFFLDRDKRLTWSEMFAEGRQANALLDLRELIATALRVNAWGLILAHNHPSGSAKPSARDVTSTLELQRICSKIGIALVDHLIVGSGGYFSFRAEGIL